MAEVKEKYLHTGLGWGLYFNDSTTPPPPPPDDNVVTGFRRTTEYDKIVRARYDGSLPYPGSTDSKNEVNSGKVSFMSSLDSNIWLYGGPHIAAPSSGTLWDTESGTGSSSGGNNIINGTPIASTVPAATATHQGEVATSTVQNFNNAATWCYYNENKPALATEVIAVKNAVKEKILYWAARPGLDFSNTVRWNSENFKGTGTGTDAPPGYSITLWVMNCMEAFDRTLSVWSPSEKVAAIKWFADHNEWQKRLQDPMYAQLFNAPTVRNGNVDAYSPKVALLSDSEPTCWGYSRSYTSGKRYNNRRCAAMQNFAALGFMQGFPALYGPVANTRNWTEEAHILFMENMAYAVFPDGTDGEENRNDNNKPSQGFGYSNIRLGYLAMVMGFAAFKGDFRCLNAVVTAGNNGSQVPAGEPGKTFKKHLQGFAKRLRGADIRYGVDFDPNSKSAAERPLFISDLDGQVNLEVSPNVKTTWRAFHNVCAYASSDLLDDDEIEGAARRDTTLGYNPYMTMKTGNVNNLVYGPGDCRWWLGSFGSSGPRDIEELGMRPYRTLRYLFLT